jgi:hypothetical protein
MSIEQQNSSSETGDRYLAGRPKITVRTARQFLEELANTSDIDLSRFERRFGRVFKPEVPIEVVRNWMFHFEEGDPHDLSDDEVIRKYWLMPLRKAIRMVWSLPDLRSKQWAIHKIIEQFLIRGDRRFFFAPMAEGYSDAFLDSLEPPSPLERIFEILTAERFHHLARICAEPECPHPYFFAKRSWTKFCSEVCAQPAQREAKKKWWNETGKRMRAKRGTARKQDVVEASKNRGAARNKKESVRHRDAAQPKTKRKEGKS